jgi:hypothetical protein
VSTTVLERGHEPTGVAIRSTIGMRVPDRRRIVRSFWSFPCLPSRGR